MIPAIGGFIFWVLFLAGFAVLRWPAMRRARRTRTAADKRSVGDVSRLVLAVVGLFVLPLVWRITGWPSSFDRSQSWLIVGTGVLAGAAFLWLFRRSHKDLGRNWSVSLELREGHRLVTGGVYAHMRHPMYTSFLLWGLMQALLVANLFAGLAGLAAVLLLIALRLPHEEAMMAETFGDEWTTYAARTKRLVPGLF